MFLRKSDEGGMVAEMKWADPLLEFADKTHEKVRLRPDVRQWLEENAPISRVSEDEPREVRIAFPNDDDAARFYERWGNAQH